MGNNTGFDERTLFAMDIAKKAGDMVRDLQKADNLQAREKGLGALGAAADIVTIADTESEKLIFSAICESFPDDGFLGEEGSSKESLSGYTWVIDPIDGTKNYSQRLPIYGVSVGYTLRTPSGGSTADPQGTPCVPQGTPCMPQGGAVYLPCIDEMYAAQRGRGAFLNGERINVSTKKDLDRACLAIGVTSRNKAEVDWFNRLMGQLYADGIVVYRLHGAVFGMVALAAGRMDIVVNKGFSLWDFCASSVIIEEAGGSFTKFDGSPVDYGRVSDHEVLSLNAGIDRKDMEKYLYPIAW